MSSNWIYHPWKENTRINDAMPIIADNIIKVNVGNSQVQASLEGLVAYADMSYLSCRVLMISGHALHHEALYCAGQTLEKYMKAILLARNTPVSNTKDLTKLISGKFPGKSAKNAHDLELLAESIGGDFSDSEFTKICSRLKPFEVAGRYPDHTLDDWSYPLELLTFLDAFVFRCRQILKIEAPGKILPNMIKKLVEDNRNGNPVMIAAIQALKDKNQYFKDMTEF